MNIKGKEAKQYIQNLSTSQKFNHSLPLDFAESINLNSRQMKETIKEMKEREKIKRRRRKKIKIRRRKKVKRRRK